MEQLLIKSEGDCFQHGDRAIPKNNYRSITLEKAEISDNRELELSVSSDKPYQRWWYYEELDHSETAVDLSRFNDSANVLFNHNRDDYIGVIVKAWLENGTMRNIIRFDTHELAERIYNSVQNEIIRNVSIGYRIDELVLVKESKNDLNTYRATSWTPLETSLVTVPADASVGVGRSYVDFRANSISTEEEATIMVDAPTIDKAEILKAERERSQALLAAGSKYNCPDLAQQGIKEGWSITELRSRIVDHKPQQKPVADVSPVGMSNSERKRYSVLKAIGYAAKHLSKDEVGLELEVSKEIQKRTGTAPKGIYIDQAELVSYRAPYETGVPGAAGDLIETELLSERFIEQLYNQWEQSEKVGLP